jgi:hypothetical protein
MNTMNIHSFYDRRRPKAEATWIAGNTMTLGRRLGRLIDSRGFQIALNVSFASARADFPHLNIREWDATIGDYVNVGRRADDERSVTYDYSPDVAA